MLAREWNRVDDLTFRLKLREDVVFHDGVPMTADDIVLSFGRMMDENQPEEIANTRQFVSSFESVTAIDDYTVEMKFSGPDPIIEKRLAGAPFWIIPKAYYESVGQLEFEASPIGTGPYKFVEYRSDEALVLDSHDDYFMGRPPIRRITFLVVPEVATRTTTISTGETQIITNIPPDQIPAIDSADVADVKQIPLANCHILVYNTHHPLLQDKRLRQALNLAIDRQLLVDSLWQGNATVMHGHQIPEWGELYNPDRPIFEYNPEKAKALLAETDYAGEEITFYVHPTYYTLGAEAAQAMVQMWKAVGLNVSIEMNEALGSIPDEELTIRQLSAGMFPFDPDTSFWRSVGPTSPTQTRWWTPEHEEFNRLGEKARLSMDTQFRYESYQTLLDIYEDEAPGTVLYRPNETYAVNKDYDWYPYSFWYLDFRSDNFRVSESTNNG